MHFSYCTFKSSFLLYMNEDNTWWPKCLKFCPSCRCRWRLFFVCWSVCFSRGHWGHFGEWTIKRQTSSLLSLFLYISNITLWVCVCVCVFMHIHILGVAWIHIAKVNPCKTESHKSCVTGIGLWVAGVSHWLETKYSLFMSCIVPFHILHSLWSSQVNVKWINCYYQLNEIWYSERLWIE